MRTISCSIFFICLIFLSEKIFAQNLSPIAGDSSGILVYADARLAILTKKNKPPGIYAAHGYRVQIYSGSDRLKATQVKVDFMRRFPGVRTYLSYIQPQFRVKIGDYKSREDAAVMYRQLYQIYTPCMIVPDIVEINNTKNDQ